MGGAQRFLLELISRLDRQKYDILAAVGNAGNGEFTESLTGLGIEVRQLKFLTRNISPVSDIRAVSEIRRIIGSYRPTTLFLNSSKAGFVGSLAAKPEISNRNMRVIYRIGGWSFNDPGPRWKSMALKNLERLSAPWKDIIIVNNRHDLEQAKKFNIRPREKLCLIHNGLDVYKMDFSPPEEARLKLFEKAAKHSGKVFQTQVSIGAIANFYPAKGLDNLVSAAEYFKHNDGVSFFIIGDGNERQKLEQLIREKGLEKKIILLGRIPDARRYLPAFDIFVLPSVKEGFPWSLIEAMAARLPVIATRVGAVPEIIENGKNGFLVDPGKPEQIVKRITEILGSDHLRKELAIQAHQTVLFNFDLEKMLKQTEALL